MRTKVAATFLVIRCFFAILSPMALQSRKIVPNSKNKKSPTPEPQKPLKHLPFSPFSVGVADRCNLQKSPKGDFAYSCKKIRREISAQNYPKWAKLKYSSLAKIKNEHQKNTDKVRKFFWCSLFFASQNRPIFKISFSLFIAPQILKCEDEYFQI